MYRNFIINDENRFSPILCQASGQESERGRERLRCHYDHNAKVSIVSTIVVEDGKWLGDKTVQYRNRHNLAIVHTTLILQDSVF